MDGPQFDRIVAALGQGMSRRGVLAVLGGLFAASLEEVVAKRAGHNRKERQQERGQDRATDATKERGAARRPGTGDEKHCPPCKKKKHGKCKKKKPDGTACPGGMCQAGKCIPTPITPPCDVCASGCPYSSVQAAVNAMPSGSTVSICAGTYKGSISINKNLTLIGAGQGNNPVVDTILDATGTGASVVSIPSSSGGPVTLQDLRITGGNVDLGGGIVSKRPLTMTRCTVNGNAASIDGGGVHSFEALTMTDCSVIGNTANEVGGGILIESGTLMMSHCTVSGNTARDVGGGIRIRTGCTAATLMDCMVSGNTATANSEGGGISTSGSTVTLTGCTVTGNSADFGGGILNSGTLNLEDSHVTENTATTDGAGIFNVGIVACSGESTVSGNTAGDPPVASNCLNAAVGSGCNTCPA
jgi:hypothetical protein